MTLAKECNLSVPLKNGNISGTYLMRLLLESSEMVHVKAHGTHRKNTVTLTVIILSKSRKLMCLLKQGI